MMQLTRRSFFASFGAGATVVASSSATHASGGSGVNPNAPAVIGGAGRLVSLPALTAVKPPGQRSPLTPVMVSHYGPTISDLQKAIADLAKQVNSLQQNDQVLAVNVQELTVFTNQVQAYCDANSSAMKSHWHQYDDGIGAHSTSVAQM